VNTTTKMMKAPSRGQDEMSEVISQQLSDIKLKHKVNILFACESGSRSYGYASPHSDYDVRFVYVHPQDWYLRVHPGRDVIERPISDGLDLNGWELRKALGLLHNSNPMLLEWLRSPVMYRENIYWTPRLRQLAEQYSSCSRAYYHYVSMAKNNRAYLAGVNVPYKKYFSTLRPLLAAKWIREHGNIPPVNFMVLVRGLVTGRPLLDAIQLLLKIKTEEIGVLDHSALNLALIHEFIELEFEQATRWKPESTPKMDSQPLDDYLNEATQMFGFI